MGLNSLLAIIACLSFISNAALLIGPNGAAILAANFESGQATCKGCTIEAGFGIVSYTKVVKTVIVATETIQPYVYMYKDGRDPYTTRETIHSAPPTGQRAWDDITPELTWTVPDLDGYTFTWPTTYAIVTALDGGVNKIKPVKRDGSPLPPKCTAVVTKVEIPRPVDCGNLVFEVTDIGYEAVPTIPPRLFEYLDGVPHVKSQFPGQDLGACQRVVAAAPGTAVPSFIDPPDARIKGRLRPRQTDTNSSSSSTSSESTTTRTSTSTSTSTSTRTSTTTSTTEEDNSGSTTLLPSEDPETLTTITRLTSTTFPTITRTSARPPQSVVQNTTVIISTTSTSSSTSSSRTRISIDITSSSLVVIDSSRTIRRGSATTVRGIPISVPSSESSIVIGNTTVPLQSSLVVIPSATTTLPRGNGTVPPMTTTLPAPPVGAGSMNAGGLGAWAIAALGGVLWWWM